MSFVSVNKLFEKSFNENWDRPALSNYRGITLHYRDVARRIEKLHIMYKKCGVQKGDKIAICSRNQANWGVSFLSAITYGAVAVPLLHEFKPGNIHHLVNHSEAKVLFVDDVVWEGLSEVEMPGLEAIIKMGTFTLLYTKNTEIDEARNHLNELFGKKYPKSFTSESMNYYEDKPDELAMINYTSGTSGFSKGVMVPYRALRSNVELAVMAEPHINNQSNVVAMLPTAHMYGFMFEFFFEMTVGAHVHFLTRVPSPKIIMQALADIKPDIVVAVPLIIEKVYKSKLKPILDRQGIKFMLKLPGLDQVIMRKIRTELVNAFGGKFEEVIIGGAAFNKEVETFFKKMEFPYTVGYGMTECAPIISYSHWDKSKLFSCGKAAPNMEIRIDSSDPQNIAGEVQVKGDNVFLGYYRNEQASSELFTEDGWFKTGDMGVMDADGYLFLRGRSKCMILGASGQNIYPEEIESVLNTMQYVVDTLVIEEGGALTALVYPDFHQAELDGISGAALESHLNASLVSANAELPNYGKIKKIEILPEDFERTPKRSIKRYLYQRN